MPSLTKKYMFAVRAVGAAGAFGLGSWVLNHYPTLKEMWSDAMSLKPNTIKTRLPVAGKKLEQYTARDEFDDTIKLTLAKAPLDYYSILYGPKGAGKSELMNHVASDPTHKAVVFLNVFTTDTKSQILDKVMDGLLNKKIVGTTGYQECIEALRLNATRVIQLSQDDAEKLAEYTPIVIFDVEIGVGDDQQQGVAAVRSTAKALAPYVHCFVVLSEANAVLEFGKDRDREEYMLVGDFTEEQAVDFLKKLGSELDLSLDDRHRANGKQLRQVFDKVGSRPAALLAMHRSFETPEEYVEGQLADAELDLVVFPHKAILKALKEHPEGVEPEFFKNHKDERVDLSDPRAVAVAMKRSNAILYDMEEGRYKLMSKAHATALRGYEPILRSKGDS